MNSTENGTTVPPSELVFYFKVIWISFGTVGSVLNLLVIAVLLSRNSLFGSIPRVLVINRSVSDLLCCILAVVLWSTDSDYTVAENGFGTFICRIWTTGYIYWTAFQISAFNLVLFTLERYLSILWAVRHRKFTLTSVGVAVAASWLLSMTVEFPSLFEAHRVGNQCVQIPLGPVAFKAFGMVIFLTYLIIPLVVMLFCYSRMILALTKVHVGTGPTSANRDRVTRQLAHTVTIVGVAYIICFAPNSVIFFLYTYGIAEMPYDGWVSQFSVFLLVFFVAINPIVYSLKVAQFRRELRHMFCCTRPDDNTRGATSTNRTNAASTVF